jgi:hypothetical protein
MRRACRLALRSRRLALRSRCRACRSALRSRSWTCRLFQADRRAKALARFSWPIPRSAPSTMAPTITRSWKRRLRSTCPPRPVRSAPAPPYRQSPSSPAAPPPCCCPPPCCPAAASRHLALILTCRLPALKRLRALPAFRALRLPGITPEGGDLVPGQTRFTPASASRQAPIPSPGEAGRVSPGPPVRRSPIAGGLASASCGRR